MVEEIRILHVDDEPDFADVTADFLEREKPHFDIVTETSAIDGLDRLADGEIDCLVSDYQMPGMDGLELLTVFREDYPELPFILFTGQGSEEIAGEALSAGATEYLQKESGTEQYRLLANRIENAVKSHRAQERVAALERIRSAIRDINQALVRATSRNEIESRVCEIIGSIETVRLVVISEVDPETRRVEPRTWVGVGEEYFDELDLTVAKQAAGPRTPHEQAFYSHEVAASRDIQEDPAFDPWREAVSETDFRALAVVPLEFEDDLYGLLSLYGGRPQSVDDATRELLKEIGDDIGHAINAIETRQDLETSEARYRRITETVSDAILTIDAASTVTYANPATEELFGYSREELTGAKLTTLMPERFRDSHREGIDRYLETGERQLDWNGVELPGQHKNGTEIPLAISFGEFEQEGERVFTGVIRDVSHRTEQRTELQRQMRDLDEFAGMVAHDLRSPLSIATGKLELAREEGGSEHLEGIAKHLDRMDRLVEDLLELARQGEDIGEVDTVPLADLVDMAREAVDGDTISVEIDPALGTIVGHRKRVRQLVENLLRNAVEHGGPDVTIRVVRLDGGFAVEDNGPGISDADREHMFDPGFTTKEDGTGFGLLIVEKIVDAHGWEIAVTDGSDGGARFEITGIDRDS